MRKAVLKRVKITKIGKLLRRKTGQNHFNAKARRKTQLRRKKMTEFAKPMEKKIKRYL